MSDEESALPCTDKLAFDTRREAEVAAIVAKYQRGIQLKAYVCRYCRLWHLSSGSSSIDTDD
jgi:hypothetical protein